MHYKYLYYNKLAIIILKIMTFHNYQKKQNATNQNIIICFFLFHNYS